MQSVCQPCNFMQNVQGHSVCLAWLWSSMTEISAKLNGAIFHWNFSKCVINVLFFAASGDNWNAPVQVSVVRKHLPVMVASISLMHCSG